MDIGLYKPTYRTYLVGPYKISACIEKGSFYVPGQTIQVDIDIENKDAKHAIESFNMKLIRVRNNRNAF